MSGRRLRGYGFDVNLTGTWEGRIQCRSKPVADFATPSAHVRNGSGVTSGGRGWAGEAPHPLLHMANFALPANRGDFGTGAVERMGATNVFIALIQYGPDCLGSALYATQGMPRPRARDFDPNGLQRRVIGQSGYQRFFTVHNKPFCIYVVLGSHRNAVQLSDVVNGALDQIEVTP